ncbi:MAG: DUF6179 domain-containing protein [Terrisporobacter sp.]
MDVNINIQGYGDILKNEIREEYFFKDILMTSYKLNLLDDTDLNRVANERLDVLKLQLKYYTKNDSSSVMVEVAENIIKGIDYTIGIYMKNLNSTELIIDSLKNESLSNMLEKGYNLIKDKVKTGRRLLDTIQINKLNIENYSYNDTIDYGIPLFFQQYDAFFAANETPGSIDYQICIENMNLEGIEYIKDYLEKLKLENEFCSKFNIDDIKELLKGYDKSSELLLINIFELVLINAIGLAMCGKFIGNLNITDIDRKNIKEKLIKLSLEELKVELLKYASICFETLNIGNNDLINYIGEATSNIASYIKNSIELDRLEKIFISFSDSNEKDYIEYRDKEKMSNTDFRKITSNIREIYSIKDKITLIKSNFNSLEDLVDMLDSECLFGDEFYQYFKSLSNMETILLFKYTLDLSFNNDCEKEWYIKFNKYILTLSDEKQKFIKNVEKKILLS